MRPFARSFTIGTLALTAIALAGNGLQSRPTQPGIGNGAGGGQLPIEEQFEQAFPGGKFQVQVGEASPQATTKAPLSEFLNQVPPDAAAAAHGTGAAEALGQVLSQVPVTGTAAGLAGLPAIAGLQAPLLAAPSLQLALPAGAGETASSGITQAGNVASAQAAGAGALPGAFGAVRVTAAATAQPAQAARQQDMLAQVDGSIRFLVKNQDQSAELQLHRYKHQPLGYKRRPAASTAQDIQTNILQRKSKAKFPRPGCRLGLP